MGKIGTYQPTDKFKNYSLPTSKPFKGHEFYKEKVWTLQEKIYKNLKKVAEFLESLYPKLTDEFRGNIKHIIEKNLETFIEDLDLMQSSLYKTPYSFSTNKLKTNQRCITEMKNVCDTLHTIKSYDREFRNLGKIKHTLNELEHLIQPTSFEKSLEKARVKRKNKAVPAKKQHILVETKRKKEEKLIVTPKKKKAISKKSKPTAKLLKSIRIDSKQLQKSKAPVPKLKQAAKKATKPKPKLSAKHKIVLTAKSKIKSSVANKKKTSH